MKKLDAGIIALTSMKIHYRVTLFLGLKLSSSYNFVLKFTV